MMKFRFLILVLSVMLCGCSHKQSDCETIRFTTWGSASEIAILKPIISDFEQKNPKIKIDLMHIPQNYFQKIHLLFASNLAPDVVFINNLNLPVYADHLEAMDVDKSLYYKQSIDALSYNGHVYAVPRDVSNLVIFYNKDMFKKVGLPYPTSDWTIDDLFMYAKKLTSNNTFGIGYEEDMYYALPYVLTLGGSIYPPERVKSQKGFIFYKNLEFFLKIYFLHP